MGLQSAEAKNKRLPFLVNDKSFGRYLIDISKNILKLKNTFINVIYWFAEINLLTDSNWYCYFAGCKFTYILNLST